MTLTSTASEVIVIDAGITDWKTLVAGLDPTIAVILLASGGNGLAALALALADYGTLDALHLVSHGSEGQLHLGDLRLNAANLGEHSDALAQIASHLTPESDLLLYGCSVAAGETGQAFVDTLSNALNGVDVAASLDRTGALSLGGDWDLEYWTGQIETMLPFAVEDIVEYRAGIFADDYAISHPPPTVSSINRVTSAASNAISVDYTVTFSQSVTGVDTSDFALTASGTAAGSIASISGSGITYTVRVNSIIGDGTLRLDLKSSGTGIQDASTNYAITGGFTSGQVYTFDHTAPVAPSTPDLTTASDTGSANTDNITSATTPTFTGTAESGSTVTLYDTNGSTVLGSSTATGGSWSITSSALSAGSHTLTAKATDVVGNAGAASLGLTVTIDNAAPTLDITSNVSALKIGETATITFTFSEDPGSTFDWNGTTGDVVVTGGTLGAISGSGLTRSATFTPTASTNGGSASITVASGTYTDAAGNSGGAGTTPALNFDTAAPVVSSVGVPANATYGAGDNLDFTVNFGEAVTVDTTGGTPHLALTVGFATRYASYVSGSGTAALLFRYATQTGDADADGITIAANLDLNGGTLKDADGNNATLTLNAEGDTTAVLVATVGNTAPVIADLDGNSIAWAGVGNTVTLDASSNAAVSDTENDAANWNGASLTVNRVTGGSADALASDVFSFNPVGFTVSGSNLQAGGQTFATFTNTGGVLNVSFANGGADATNALVQAVMRGVLYRNDTPTGDTTIRFSLSDGSTASTADVTVTSDTIYVTNTTDTTDTATIDVTNGISFREAVAIAAADTTGSQTLVLGSAFATTGTTLVGNLTIGESLTLNADAVTSGTILTGGTVTIANSGGPPWILTITNTMGGSATIASILDSLNGALTKTGAGTLTLSGTNTYTRVTTVSEGTLAVSGGAAIANSSTVIVANGATLALNASESINALSGAGNVTLGSHVLTVGSGNGTFSGIISGTGALVSRGSLTLSGANTYTGATTVSAGRLSISNDSALGTTAGDTTVASGAALWLSGGISIAENLTLSGTGNKNSGALVSSGSNTVSGTVAMAANTTVSASGDLTLSGVLSGGFALTKTGDGTLTLSAANTYTGATTVSAGMLVVANATALGTTAGVTTVANGAALALTGGISIAENLTLSGSGIASAGALVSAIGTNTVSGTLAMAADTTVTATSDLILSGVLSGAFALTSTGAGTLTLSGANTYTGATSVIAGTLAVNGALSGTSSVTVADGATLGGAGSIGVAGASGAVIVQSGGTLAAGDGVGTLTLNNGLTVAAGGVISSELFGTAVGADYDQIKVYGTVTLTDATLSIALGNFSPIGGSNFTLIDNDGSTDAITGMVKVGGVSLADKATFTIGGQSFTISYTGGDGNDLVLSATIPHTEPPAPPPPPSPPVDGVPVVTTPGDGGTTITIPVVVPTRPDDPGTPNSQLADIPLVTAPDGRPIVQVSVPVGVGLQAQGLPNPVSGDAAQAELVLRIERVAGGNPELTNDGQVFLASLDPSEPLTVQTITATAGAGFDPNVPFVISGSTNPADGKQAVILDARALPSGTLIQVDNIDFVAIVGAVRVIGGAGQNAASGDGSAQWIVLGADDDVIHGGGGNDVVASKGGNDRLYGDEGDDTIVGGVGDDHLEGGTGNDLLQGGMSDAGAWSFALSPDGNMHASYNASQNLLTDTQNASLVGQWSGSNVLDARLALVHQDYTQLETISLLFQGLTGELPTLQAMNTFATQGWSRAELLHAAWTWYEGTLPAGTPPPDKMKALISQTWGLEHATAQNIQIGVDFLAQGGSWSEGLGYLVAHANVRGQITTEGRLNLTQAGQIGEAGWGLDSGNDVLIGGEGNDVLIGGNGNDILDGGAGTDLAAFLGALPHFSVQLRASTASAATADQKELVLRNALSGEEDILRDVELLQIGGQAYRLQLQGLQEGAAHQPLAAHVQAMGSEEIVLVGLPAF